MNWDIYIFIAFCVFMLMVGMRFRQRWLDRKKPADAPRINKNQRPKMAETTTEEPPFVRERRIRREKRVRFFTIAQLVVLFGLMVFMLPSLVRNIMVPQTINFPNFFLRCFIFVFTIYIFFLGYTKVFGRKSKEKEKE